MAAMRAHLLLLLCLLLVALANGQRRRPPQEDEDYGRGNRLSGRPPGGRSGQPDLSRDVGQFPYPRGETPVFNFDQGDEGFIGTIPPLIHALDVDVEQRDRQMLNETIESCEEIKR